jgi:phosphatidylglycerol:prolipoprotein diacylglycerol transferase
MGLMVLYCGLMGLWYWKRDKAPEKDYLPIIGAIVAGGLIGARLVHVFFYDWAYYSHHLLEIPMLWKGGLASHGGAVGMVLGIWLYCRYKGQVYYWWVYDRLAVGLPFGAVLIRIGNLFNSELYGKPTDVPWAFVFPTVDLLPRHPVQLYEAGCYLIITIIIIGLYTQKSRKLHFGTLSGLFLVLINITRFGLEFFKESPLLFGPFNMAQVLCVPFILLGVLILWLSVRGKLD